MLCRKFSLLALLLLCAGVTSHAQAASPDHLLVSAIQNNDIRFIKQKLDTGLEPDYRLKGETLLMICAREDREELVSLLVGKGADVNAKSSKGHSAMSYSARYGHLAIVQYLLNHGAEVNITNKNGWTPLLKAARGGHLDVVDYLLAHDADIHSRNSGGFDALALARRYKHRKVVKYLKGYK